MFGRYICFTQSCNISILKIFLNFRSEKDNKLALQTKWNCQPWHKPLKFLTLSTQILNPNLPWSHLNCQTAGSRRKVLQRQEKNFAKQHRNPWSSPPPVYQDLIRRHDSPFLKKPSSICQSGWRENRNAFPVIRWVRKGPRTRISAMLTGSAGSRRWDKGGPGLQNFFSALRALVWSKNEGDHRAPPLDPPLTGITLRLRRRLEKNGFDSNWST